MCRKEPNGCSQSPEIAKGIFGNKGVGSASTEMTCMSHFQLPLSRYPTPHIKVKMVASKKYKMAVVVGGRDMAQSIPCVLHKREVEIVDSLELMAS